MGWFGKKKKPGEIPPAGPASATPGKPGEAIGRYTIKKMIGKGGMGSVYLALDPLIGRQVAIKVISVRPDLAEEEAQQYRERFLREAQAAGALIHPNIVAVHD
ncbi:MAG: protein kinase domain-containing protein, partial [bacterium]